MRLSSCNALCVQSTTLHFSDDSLFALYCANCRYVEHLSQHPDSLLVRFYGMHRCGSFCLVRFVFVLFVVATMELCSVKSLWHILIWSFIHCIAWYVYTIFFNTVNRVKFRTSKIYFVIMSSVFNTEKHIDIKYVFFIIIAYSNVMMCHHEIPKMS